DTGGTVVMQGDHVDQSNDESGTGDRHLHRVPEFARHECLRQHAQQGRTEDDEYRQDGVIDQPGERDRVSACSQQLRAHFTPPTAMPDAGAGSLLPTSCSVCWTAGLMTSSTG